MTNANPLITLRNTAIIWIGCAVACFVGTWWLYHFLSDAGQKVMADIEKSTVNMTLLQDEGVVTKKDWEDMSSSQQSEERWTTMKMLVPNLAKLVAPGTPAAAQNIANMKLISENTSKPYIKWLEASWTPEAQDTLAKTQSDIAEIIPLFAGISELAGTDDIHGKVTLASLIDYIQTVIVEKFGLGNVAGEIGIDHVEFLEETPEIGIYEVPLRFENIDNQNILKLMGFLRKTGAVIVTENGNTLTIAHQEPLTMDSTKNTISSLKNLLITVKSLSVSPTTIDKTVQEVNISTRNNHLWDIDMVLRFYIRGVSRDHIILLDNRIASWLDTKPNAPESLIAQANALIKTCSKCAQLSEIRDIQSLLTGARAAYDSIVVKEKNVKESSNPLEIIERRTSLITTLETLKKKLDTLGTLLSSPTQ